MRPSASVAVELLIGVCYMITRAQAGCNQDNCLRALFPTNNPTRLASAESFCHTYTQGISTATTGFPSDFTSACGSTPSRYSSVCSCAPTPTTSSTISTTFTTLSTTSTTTSTTSTAPSCSPTPYETFQNGGFECGLYPWRALVTEGTTYALTSPGYTGSFAFQVDQDAPLDGVGIGQASLQQLFYITPGTQYLLTFETFFNIGGGFIGVKFNGVPVYTVDADDKNGPGVWNSNSISFTASEGQYLLEFEFLFGAPVVVAKIDNVVLTPGT